MWRSILRNPLLLPVAVMVTVGVGGMFAAVPAAAAQPPRTSSHTLTEHVDGVTVVTVGVTVAQTVRSALSCKKEVDQISKAVPPNSGSPKGGHVVCGSNGQIVSYGSPATITYRALPQSYVAAGEALFEQYCSSCHTADARGSTAAPNLVGVGPATVNFWVTTGRMPAEGPKSTQVQPKPPLLTNHQANEIAAFINSLSPSAPYIPSVHLKGATLADGASLFALNCAACHTITGAGDELAYGTNAPSLHHATPTQVAEAVRTGPANMPKFSGNLSDAQVRDVVAYVTEKIQHPSNPGGAGLGGIGPVAEGFVALLFGVGGLMLVCFWIGDRS